MASDRTFRICEGVPYVGATAYPGSSQVNSVPDHPRWSWVGFRLPTPAGWQIAVLWQRQIGSTDHAGTMGNAGPAWSRDADLRAAYDLPPVEDGTVEEVNAYITAALASTGASAPAHPSTP